MQRGGGGPLAVRLRGGKIGAAVPAALGIVVFANAYFLNVGVLWDILDPVRMLTELTWAAVANKANVVRPDATE